VGMFQQRGMPTSEDLGGHGTRKGATSLLANAQRSTSPPQEICQAENYVRPSPRTNFVCSLFATEV
jgi:hypothetical protein